jgi:hypothetical protein
MVRISITRLNRTRLYISFGKDKWKLHIWDRPHTPKDKLYLFEIVPLPQVCRRSQINIICLSRVCRRSQINIMCLSRVCGRSQINIICLSRVCGRSQINIICLSECADDLKCVIFICLSRSWCKAWSCSIVL